MTGDVRRNYGCKRKEKRLEIRKIIHAKERYMELLLMADEQQDMIRRYLERGELFTLCEAEEVRGVCVVTDEGAGVCELKNIAVLPAFRGKGYGRELVGRMEEYCRKKAFRLMLVGTGETPGILKFYRSCGFRLSHRVENFFTDNYACPIVENGVLLKDMVYLKKEL